MKIDFNLPPTPEQAPTRDERELPDDLSMGLGAVIKQIRTARGLSQTEVGKRAGMGTATVQSIESGKQRLTVIQLTWLADALEMDLAIGMTPKGSNDGDGQA